MAGEGSVTLNEVKGHALGYAPFALPRPFSATRVLILSSGPPPTPEPGPEEG
jgi:hypothetical protein